jgi:hypothetical protein
MTQEYNNNNYEFYRIEDNSIPTISYNIMQGTYMEQNGYRFISDVVSDTTDGRLRRFDKEWANETTVIQETGTNTTITDIKFINGYYYVCLPFSNLLRKYDDDFNLIDSYTITRPVKIFKYKNKWFIIDTINWTISRYDSNTNGNFSTDNILTFTNTDSFSSLFSTDFTIHINYRELINYKNGDLIIPTFSTSTTSKSYINIFDLESMVTATVNTGTFQTQKLSSELNEIPISIYYMPIVINGHYIIFERNSTFALHTCIGYWILDSNFNLISKRSNLDIDARLISSDNENNIIITPIAFSPGTLVSKKIK